MKLKLCANEHQIQAAFFQQISIDPILRKYRPNIFSIPNGGKRDIAVAMKLKKEGVTPGVWDVFCAIPCNGFHGFFIEFKSGHNNLTVNQTIFKSIVETYNYFFAICYSAEDAIDILKKYLEKNTNNAPLYNLPLFCRD